MASAGGARQALRGLLNDVALRLRFEANLSKRRFVLLQILLQDVRERLGLRRAQVDALEILDGDRVWRGLINGSEHQEEVPQVYAHLYAVGVVLSVVGGVGEVQFRLWLSWCHVPSMDEQVGGAERPGSRLPGRDALFRSSHPFQFGGYANFGI